MPRCRRRKERIRTLGSGSRTEGRTERIIHWTAVSAPATVPPAREERSRLCDDTRQALTRRQGGIVALGSTFCGDSRSLASQEEESSASDQVLTLLLVEFVRPKGGPGPRREVSKRPSRWGTTSRSAEISRNEEGDHLAIGRDLRT